MFRDFTGSYVTPSTHFSHFPSNTQQMSSAAAAGAEGAIIAMSDGGGRKRKRARTGSQSRSKAAIIARGGVNSMGFAFPERYRTKLRYADEFKMVTASSTGSWIFRANSVFDPDYTGTGHQPRGFDQLCSSSGPYNRYCVTGVTWRLRLCGTTDGIATVVNQDTNVATTVLTALEQRSSARTYYCPYVSGGGGVPPAIKFRTNNAKEAGVTLTNLRTDDKYSGVYNSNPTETQNLVIAWNSVDITTLGSVYLWIEAIYEVEFFDVTLIPAS